jgi:hypothetical protein
MIMHRFADYAEVENNIGTGVGMGVEEPANWRACLTGLTNETPQLSGKESLREAIAADHFQIRAQGAVEGGGEDRSICDSTQYQRSFRLGRAEALNCKSDCSQIPIEPTRCTRLANQREANIDA